MEKNEQVHNDHRSKAAIFQSSFNDRLGTSKPTTSFLTVCCIDQKCYKIQKFLSHKKETDDVVNILPTDKATRPYGFNGVFIKACQNLIVVDLYALIEVFLSWENEPADCNASFITLIPKQKIINAQVTLDQYLSLISQSRSSPSYPLTDCKKIILKLVHTNQQGSSQIKIYSRLSSIGL